MFLILPALIPPIIKGVGGLAAYFLSRAAIRRQNKYNLPENQISRLRRAGVPLAASKYFENTQQGVEDTSGIQYAAEGLAGYVDTSMKINQIKLLKEQIKKATSEADIAQNLLELSEDDLEYWLNQGVVVQGKGYTMNQFKHHLDMAFKETQNMIQGYEREIKEIDAYIANSTQEEEIKIAENKVEDLLESYMLKRNIRVNNEQIQIAAHTIINQMKEGGLSFVEAIALNQLLAAGARINVPGVQIGSQ